MFGAGGIKCVFGIHREPIRRSSPFGCGRIGCRVGVEPVEPDQGAVVHAAAEAGFHRRVGTDHVYVYDTVRFVDRRCVDGVCDRIGRLVVCRPLPDAVLQSGQSVRCGALLCGGRTAGRKQQEQQEAFHGAVRFMLRSRGCRVPRRGRRWPATPRAALFRASGTGCRGRASRP